MDHRAKNVLAVVQSILRLTRAPDIRAYREAAEGRVAALARAHTLLAHDNWIGAGLRAILACPPSGLMRQAGMVEERRVSGSS
ncbi:HWE histidine kinase domain-containing protein [Muricoccus nepalensis]|uniref:HWE histidine kinase domain-containing protein n=1 Tax=Muricoccus nepalensis TaxID=1854500 RepID=UPI00240D561D|nr:HWE histidine kinase domain-containing protein [Roseomonas nepalensis]